LKYVSAIVGMALTVGKYTSIARLVIVDNALLVGKRSSGNNTGVALSSGSNVFE
jgi:hypothetical protein